MLDGSASTDAEGALAKIEWFEEGELLASGAQVSVDFSLGQHILTLRVTDSSGATDIDFVAMTVEET